MTSDKNTLLQEADASAKDKLISVGGCADTPSDLVAEDNADGNRPCLGNGQTVLMRTPTRIHVLPGHGCGYQEGYLVSDGGFC